MTKLLAYACLVGLTALFLFHYSSSADTADAGKLTLHTRSRAPSDPRQPFDFRLAERTVEWNPHETAIVVCDMWDQHWCRGAAQRVAELAGPMNDLLKMSRERGMLIIHCPSTTVDFYADTPQRRRAQSAKFAQTPLPISAESRWGTTWCYPDPQLEMEMPIDDSDMGCDCAEKCPLGNPWTRQIATIEIGPDDAITDDGQEVYNLLRQEGIKHVLILGVHLNMCVLGRPFAIRQLRYLGEDVVLVRDMTDTMYNSQMPPGVNHFAGTDLVVEHIEKFWCPTIDSTDLVGGKPFRFAEDTRE